MFQGTEVLVTHDSYIVFTKGKNGGRIAYVQLEPMLKALKALGIDDGSGPVSTEYNKALVELADYLRTH